VTFSKAGSISKSTVTPDIDSHRYVLADIEPKPRMIVWNTVKFEFVIDYE
jgi:hypothetical protein